MSGAKKRVPKRRFKEFLNAGDWERRKLSDVADVRDGTHDSPKFYNDGFPLVTSKNLKGGSIDFSDCSFISEQDFNEINKRSKVEPGDILFGMIGTIGNPAIVEHTGFAIKNVALIKEGNIINNRFIYHLLSSKVFENYIARENAGGTQKFIALNQIRNFDFLAPTLVEQNKIIELLDCISQNITLHQRKLDKLQATKKALLQEMFPEEGQDKPKRRFKGFTDAWEWRMLGEIGKWYKGIGGTKDDLNTKRSGRMFVHYADLYQTSEFLTTVVHWTTNEDIGSLITPNSILFPMSDVTPYGLARTTSCKINEVRAGGDVLINTIDRSIDSDFVSIYINLFSKNILPFVTGTTVKHINSKALSELTILIPSFEEQLKIVNVVNFYNKVITLHQRKLDKLKNLKQAYLNEMFV